MSSNRLVCAREGVRAQGAVPRWRALDGALFVSQAQSALQQGVLVPLRCRTTFRSLVMIWLGGVRPQRCARLCMQALLVHLSVPALSCARSALDFFASRRNVDRLPICQPCPACDRNWLSTAAAAAQQGRLRLRCTAPRRCTSLDAEEKNQQASYILLKIQTPKMSRQRERSDNDGGGQARSARSSEHAHAHTPPHTATRTPHAHTTPLSV